MDRNDVDEAFGFYPDAMVVYSTADGFIYDKGVCAKRHAKKLVDRTVLIWSREGGEGISV